MNYPSRNLRYNLKVVSEEWRLFSATQIVQVIESRSTCQPLNIVTYSLNIVTYSFGEYESHLMTNIARHT